VDTHGGVKGLKKIFGPEIVLTCANPSIIQKYFFRHFDPSFVVLPFVV